MTNTEKALAIIADFCTDEYGDGVEYRTPSFFAEDLHNVPLAYTTDDEENELQVYADVVDYRLIYTKDGVTVKTDEYDNYEEFERDALNQLDFDELIADCDGTYID